MENTYRYLGFSLGIESLDVKWVKHFEEKSRLTEFIATARFGFAIVTPSGRIRNTEMDPRYGDYLPRGRGPTSPLDIASVTT